MRQSELFHETIYDALGTTILALGGYKAVAHRLWPARPNSYTALKHAVNPSKREALHPHEVELIVQWGRDINCHAVMEYLSCAARYKDPEPVEPEDEQLQLDRRIAELGDVLTTLLQKRERIPRRRASR